MATIINDEDSKSGNESDEGVGLVIGVVVVIITVFLFIAYVLPSLRGSDSNTTENVPDKADVSISKSV
jgi:hypothetical protein